LGAAVGDVVGVTVVSADVVVVGAVVVVSTGVVVVASPPHPVIINIQTNKNVANIGVFFTGCLLNFLTYPDNQVVTLITS
jgi:hypothetical protein